MRREEKARKGKKGVVDIELGEVGRVVGVGKKEGRKEEKEEETHWLLELVLILLTFAFKTVVFLVRLVLKVLGRLIVGVNRCAAKA